MVALNLQTNDVPTQLHRALFEQQVGSPRSDCPLSTVAHLNHKEALHYGNGA